MLARQTQVLELIARAAPLHEVLTEILTSLESLMPGARCSVLLLDRDRGTLHHGAAPSLPEHYVAAIDGMAIGADAGSCGTAAALNTAVVATDVRTDPRWIRFRHIADSAALRSCWSTPIDGPDGLPVGTFAVYHHVPHSPTRREALFVERFTHLTAVAIAHAALIGDLVSSEERFRRSFDDNPIGMAILGPDRVIARCNTALTTLALDGSEPVGRPFTALLTPTQGSLDDRFETLDGGHAARVVFEAALHRAGRPDVDIEATMSLLHGHDGGPAQYIVNVLDLTERRAAERHRRALLEAETARRTAEELSHVKSELLAAVGHEVRTPIQAIVGFAELLGTIDLEPERRREALDHISAAAGHVMDLLTDVLDLSRLEAGALPLALEPVRVDEVVDEVFALLSAKAEQRRVGLSHDVDDQVVLADRRRLRQVLLNLVGNSVRHGNTGGSVDVRVLRTADPTWVVLSVDDDGPGIPPDFLPRAFTAFARPSAASADEPPATEAAADGPHEDGIGLGLGLAHGLMDAMGGDLALSRSTSTGTSITLRLPRPEASS
ncbi:GAF domain-containing protein [Nostocoides sp. F2B08]|nr:GAF domain-containing protein [Tetrasphaera sp. F2B08]